MTVNLNTNYPSTWDEENNTSSQKCTVWRKRIEGNVNFEIKYYTDYEVRTGFKIYEAGAEDVPIA